MDTFPLRSFLIWRLVVKKLFLRKGNGEKKWRHAKVNKEQDWKSVAIVLMAWTIQIWSFWFKLASKCTEEVSREVQKWVSAAICKKWSRLQKKSSERPSKILENYSWRLFREITRKLSKRVQAVLNYKGEHAKYWLLSLLELFRLYFCIIYCISIYVLQMFPTLLEKDKEMWGRSRPLHRIALTSSGLHDKPVIYKSSEYILSLTLCLTDIYIYSAQCELILLLRLYVG